MADVELAPNPSGAVFSAEVLERHPGAWTISDDMIVRERCAIFQARRDALVKRLQAVPGLACEPPEGAFYVYVSCAGWLGKRTLQGKVLENDADVTTFLLEAARLALPNGAGYGLSPYFRVSFAAEQALLERACDRLAAVANTLS